MFRIALALGKTVHEIEGLTFRELREWEIYFSRKPPLEEMVDWQFATLLYVVSHALSKKAPGLPEWSLYERYRPKTPEELSRALRRQFGIEE